MRKTSWAPVIVVRAASGALWYEPDRDPRPAEGYIGRQNHGHDDTVFFKEISVRPLAR